MEHKYSMNEGKLRSGSNAAVSNAGLCRFQPKNADDRSFDGRYGTFKFNPGSFFAIALVLESPSAASTSSWSSWSSRTTSPELSSSSAKLRLILKLAIREIFEERTKTMRMSETIDRVSCKQCWTPQIPAVKCRRPELRWPIWDMTGPASISCGLSIIVEQLVFKPATPELPPSSTVLISSSWSSWCSNQRHRSCHHRGEHRLSQHLFNYVRSWLQYQPVIAECRPQLAATITQLCAAAMKPVFCQEFFSGVSS